MGHRSVSPQIAHQWSLEKLLLCLINMEEWPSAIGESSHLEKLVLETPFLEALPPSFGRDLRNLKYLELRSCQSLKRLPDSFLLMDQLIKLIVEDCPLQELPFETVEGGSETMTASGGQGTLSNLERPLLRLQHFGLHKTQISEISFPTGVCPELQYLAIRDCQDLVEVGTLPNALRELHLIDCPKLRKIKRLSGFAKCLLHLQHLELRNTAISEISFPTGVCPNLQHLDIRECKELVEVGTLPNALRKLQLIDCPKLRKIEWLSGFAKCLLHLQHLELHNTAISEVSFPTGVCPNLQHLNIKDCEGLIEVRTLPNALIILELDNCPKLKLMSIADLAQVMQLREIRVHLCSGLEELLGVGYLKSLDVLQVSRCMKLKSITGLEQLTQLRELDVSNCCELKELLGVGHLKSLEVLQASGCAKLKSILGVDQLTQLRKLDVPFNIS